MKKTGFAEDQIAFALRQAEAGTPIIEVCRNMGVSEQTFYRWKKLHAGMGVAELRWIKQLEEQNRKLKTLVADTVRPPKNRNSKRRAQRSLSPKSLVSARSSSSMSTSLESCEAAPKMSPTPERPTRPAPPPRFWLLRVRAWSMRMRRMVLAMIPKNKLRDSRLKFC
jgi:putative transposase